MRKPAGQTPDWSTAGVLQRVNGHRLVNRAEEGRTRWEQERTRYGRAGKRKAGQCKFRHILYNTAGKGRARQVERNRVNQRGKQDTRLYSRVRKH